MDCMSKRSSILLHQRFAMPHSRLELLLEDEIIGSLDSNAVGDADFYMAMQVENNSVIRLIKKDTYIVRFEAKLPEHVKRMVTISTLYGDITNGYKASRGFALILAKDGLSCSVLTIRKPFLVLSSDKSPKTETCFRYLKGCNTARVEIFDKNEKSLAKMSIYHVKQNFSALLPSFEDTHMVLLSNKNKIKLNVTNLFFGLALSSEVHFSRNKDEGNDLQTLSLSHGAPNIENWKDNEVEITNLPFGAGPSDLGSKVEVQAIVLTPARVFLVTREDQYSVMHVVYMPGAWPTSGYWPANQLNHHRLYWRPRDSFQIYPLLKSALVIAGEDYFLIGKSDTGSWKWNRAPISLRDGDPIFFRHLKKASSESQVILSVTEAYLKVFRVIDSHSSILKFDIVGTLEKHHFQFVNRFKIDKFVDALIISQNLIYVVADDKSRQRVFGMFRCVMNLPETCQLISQTQIISSHAKILVAPDKVFWVIDTMTAGVNVYDLNQLAFDYSRSFRLTMTPTRRFSLSDKLGGSEVQPLLQMKETILLADSSIYTLMASILMKSTGKKDTYFLTLSLEDPSGLIKLRKANKQYSQSNASFVTSESYSLYYKARGYDKTLKILIPDAYQGMTISNLGKFHQTAPEEYETRGMNLVLQGPDSVYFHQSISAISRQNFEVSISDRLSAVHSGQRLADIVQGFVQNASLDCITGTPQWKIGRWGQISGMVCGNTSGVLENYFRKVSQFVLVDEPRDSSDSFSSRFSSSKELIKSRLLEASSRSDRYGYSQQVVQSNSKLTIRDSFILFTDTDKLLFILNDKLSVVSLERGVELVPAIQLRDKSTGDRLNLADCFKMFCTSDPFRLHIIQLTFLCEATESVISMVNFSVNTFALRPSYEAEVFAADRKTMTPAASMVYLHPLLFVLDKSVQSSRNAKHLVVYSVFKFTKRSIALIPLFYSGLALGLEDSEIKCFEASSDILIMGGLFKGIAYLWTASISSDKSEIMKPASIPLNFTQKPSDMLIKRFDDGWHLFLVTESSVSEFLINDLLKVTRLQDFKHALVCDVDSTKEVYKQGEFLMLYCVNSKDDKSEKENIVLLYRSSENKVDRSSVVYPVEQLTLTTGEAQPPRILGTFSGSKDRDFSFFTATSDRSVSIYKVNTEATFNFWSDEPALSKHSTFSLIIQNVMDTKNVHFVPKFSLPSFPHWELLIHVLVFFAILGMILSVVRPRRKRKQQKRIQIDRKEDFKQQYEALMRPQIPTPVVVFGLGKHSHN